MTRVDGMFGKNKLINILFFDFQMGFSTGLDYTCANSNHSRGLLFLYVLCVLYGWKDGYQPFFSLYHYPFPIRRVEMS